MNMSSSELNLNVVVSEGTIQFSDSSAVGRHDEIAEAVGKVLHDNPDVKLIMVKALIHAAAEEGHLDRDELEVMLDQADNVLHNILEVLPNV